CSSDLLPSMLRALLVCKCIDNDQKASLRRLISRSSIQASNHLQQCRHTKVICRSSIEEMLIGSRLWPGVVGKSHVMEGPRKCSRSHHRMGDGHSIEPRTELQECLIRKHKTSSSRIACRVNENWGAIAVRVIEGLVR